MTADAGANLKELMVRMGQDSERAALIYLHSSAKRQRALADEVGRMAAASLAESKAAKLSGTQRARSGHASRMVLLTPLVAHRLSWANDGRPDRDSNAGPTA